MHFTIIHNYENFEKSEHNNYDFIGPCTPTGSSESSTTGGNYNEKPVIGTIVPFEVGNTMSFMQV